MGQSSSRTPGHRRTPAAPKVTNTDRAVLALKSHRQRLTGEQKRLEAEIEKGREAAKTRLMAGQRDRAALLLAVVKSRREALLQVERSLLKIEEQLLDIEAARRTVDSARLAEEVNGVLKTLLAAVTVERVMQLQEDAEESRAQMAEVAELLGYAPGSTLEADREVAREMEDLQITIAKEALAREGMPLAPVALPLPSKPKKHKHREKDKDRERDPEREARRAARKAEKARLRAEAEAQGLAEGGGEQGAPSGPASAFTSFAGNEEGEEVEEEEEGLGELPPLAPDLPPPGEARTPEQRDEEEGGRVLVPA